ncbi:hypothetical protein NEMBOFW57_010137 [Staphylotrichum longicolle]|uniref:Uncharacterized protein n=1 Tax=Staphylotrichum longicolle TaxID=669026 RepID=A0AAD4EQ84_9PEZI|nr:hypothetical protein NEMBOFW57_010137 [Staphylotrichum longicolle]
MPSNPKNHSKSSSSAHSKSGSSGGSSSHGDKKGKKKASPPAEHQPEAQPEPQPEYPEYQRLFAVVFRNSEWDLYNKRHCALYIEHFNQFYDPWRKNMIDIFIGPRGWEARESEGQASRHLATDIFNAPINKSSKEWNCQNWVEGALQRLQHAGWLTKEEAESAFDSVLTVVLQAPYDPIHYPIAAADSVQDDN